MFQCLVRLVVLAIAAAIVSAQPAVPVSLPQVAYSTFVHNGPASVVFSLAVDKAGYAYVPGGGPGIGGPRCGFLKKLNQTGTAAVWSVCLSMYQVNTIALDAAGYIYVAGDNQPFGFSEGLVYSSTVMKLSPDAQQTVYSTSIPGAFAAKLVLDTDGNAYILGVPAATFQATPGAYLTSGSNTFALKLNAVGAVQYATYLDFLFSYAYPVGIGGIAVDSKGQVWVVGRTCADGGKVSSGCSAAIGVRKLDASGAHLLVSKAFGGGRGDSGIGVAVDATDSVWIVGTVDSAKVPITPNAVEPERPPTASLAGPTPLFGYALKLTPSGDVLYGSYVDARFSSGINSNTSIVSVAVDGAGNPYFSVNSERFTQLTTGRVMALSSDGATVLVSKVFASPVQAIALDGNGGLYVAGSTTGGKTTAGAYQPSYPGGNASGIAAKFDLTTQDSAAQLDSLLNAGSLNHGLGLPVPGEILTMFGKNLPSNPTITFGGFAAPILYADTNQINLVVPFEAGPMGGAFSVKGSDGRELADDYVVSPFLGIGGFSPGLFTANGSGTGQLAALNQDTSLNSSDNPAKAGSVVSVFLTGAGAMTPPIGDGPLGPLEPPFPAPVQRVNATVNGVDAPVLFAGQAPGLIAGLVQVNVQIPAGTASGNATLVVNIGGVKSQSSGATIAVQ